MNHVHYEDRIRFIEALLRDKFHLVPLEVEPIAYLPDIPFYFNNYVYKLSVSHESTSSTKDDSAPLPAGVSSPLPSTTEPFTLIMRLSNHLADGMNNTNRVQNEVATIALTRAALEPPGLAHLVPAVYGWGALDPVPAATTSTADASAPVWGWILQQYMPGTIPEDDWPTLSLADKRAVLAQMASIVAAIQAAPLPAGVGYGGLTFDSAGQITGGEMVLVPGGPFADYADLIRGVLGVALADADTSPALNGWRDTPLRARLDAFVAGGVPRVLAGMDTARTLVHADFTANNLLWDAASKKLTAVLDFDWAFVGTAGDEFLRSLRGIGTLPGLYTEDEEQATLRAALLSGVFPDPLPEAKEGGVDWGVAQAWEECLRAVGAKRPSTIPGMEVLSGLQWLSETIAPFALVHPVMLKRASEEKTAKAKAQNEQWLVAYLESNGF